MMDNEKFGIWGRTNLGEIFRFAWIEDSSGVVYDRKIMLLDNDGNNPEEYRLNYEEHIIKHSKKIIDLIEDKDIVEIELSEEFVEKKDKKKLIQIGDIYTKETLQKDIDNGIITRILTILPYNQYMANCYKVGGGENEASND